MLFLSVRVRVLSRTLPGGVVIMTHYKETNTIVCFFLHISLTLTYCNRKLWLFCLLFFSKLHSFVLVLSFLRFLDLFLTVMAPLVLKSQDYTRTLQQSRRSTFCLDRWAPHNKQQRTEWNVTTENNASPCSVLFSVRVVCCPCWTTTPFTCGSWWLGCPEKWVGLGKRVWSPSKKLEITASLEDLVLRAAGI